jgi:hypothetical protein
VDMGTFRVCLAFEYQVTFGLLNTSKRPEQYSECGRFSFHRQFYFNHICRRTKYRSSCQMLQNDGNSVPGTQTQPLDTARFRRMLESDELDSRETER